MQRPQANSRRFKIELYFPRFNPVGRVEYSILLFEYSSDVNFSKNTFNGALLHSIVVGPPPGFLQT